MAMLNRLTSKKETYEDEKLKRLQELENAEEDLNLNFMVFYHLANNEGFYGREKGDPSAEIVRVGFNYAIDFQNKRVMHAYGMTQNDVSYYYFGDYGKTWGLTKNDFEESLN